jgi:hypothetical protein
MTQPSSRFRVRFQFPLWVLLALPVACAFLLLVLSRSGLSPTALADKWIYHLEFPIKDGDWLGGGGNLGFVALVTGPDNVGTYYRVFNSVQRDGVLRCYIHTGTDSWIDDKTVPPAFPAQLAALLPKLPPSVRPGDPRNCVVVAFSVNWRWVVRTYPYPGPKEFNDLMNALRQGNVQ